MKTARTITLDEALAEPSSEADILASVARGATETLATLAEQRWTKTMRLRAWRERRIRHLVRAVEAAGPSALDGALVTVARRREEGDPWALWAAIALLLGVLRDPQAQLEALLTGLEDHREVSIAGEALAVSIQGLAFARDWLHATPPSLRAVAVEALAHLGELPPKALDEALRDPSLWVVAAALRALKRPSRAELGRLVELLEAQDVEVVDWAGRALLRAGDTTPLGALRERASIRASLGARAVEWLVLAGSAADIELLVEVARARPSSAWLSGLGRAGHAHVWSYLVHYVADTRLGESAQDALVTLFGELVPREHRDEANAWRVAIAARRWDSSARLRRGEPWTAAAVVAECSSPEISAREIALRIDELTARLGAAPPAIDLARLRGPSSEDVARLLAPLAALPHRPGSWTP